MEFEFLFDVDDWIAFNKYELKNSKQFKRSIFISVIIMPLMFSIFLFIDNLNGRFNWFVALFYLSISILWLIFYPKRLYAKAIRNIRKKIDTKQNDAILGWHTYSFTNDFILFKNDKSETNIRWNGIVNFIEIKDYFFLFDSSISGFIIPKAKIKNHLPEFKLLFDEKSKHI